MRTLLFGGLLFCATIAQADENFCGYLPATELKATFDVRNGNSHLRVTLPKRYLDKKNGNADFQKLTLSYGDKQEFRVDVRVEDDDDNTLLAIIHMPEAHSRLFLDATYHRHHHGCFSVLQAAFVANKRVEEAKTP